MNAFSLQRETSSTLLFILFIYDLILLYIYIYIVLIRPMLLYYFFDLFTI